MNFTLVERGDKRLIEGIAGQPLLHDGDDGATLVEACFNNRTKRLLLYPENLTDRFFDLSSREAGTVLQKLRTYQVRLAVVRSPSSQPLSQRFEELMVEESRDKYFQIFAERSAAEAWLLGN
jgi:hypothetical protein